MSAERAGPVLWSVMNADTGTLRVSCYKRQELAEAWCRRYSSNYSRYVAVPLFLMPFEVATGAKLDQAAGDRS